MHLDNLIRTTVGIDWSRIGGRQGSAIPVELASAALHVGALGAGISLDDLSSTNIQSEWADSIRKKFARDNILPLVESLSEKLPFSRHSANPCQLLDPRPAGNSVDSVVSFLMQGFNFSSARASGIVAYANTFKDQPVGVFDPDDALSCLYDQVRTKKLINAALSNLDDLLGQTNSSEIKVVDAGCGIPLVSIVLALRSNRVRVLAIEANPITADIAAHLVEVFGLKDQISILNADAAKLKLDSNPDLLISETLNTALISEGFIDIMANLLPQCRQETRVVPEALTISSALSLTGSDEAIIGYNLVERNDSIPVLYPLGFVPNYSWKAAKESLRTISVPLCLSLEKLKACPENRIFLQTEVELYEGKNGKESIMLRPSESLITRPFHLLSFKEIEDSLVVRYGDPSKWPEHELEIILNYEVGDIKSIRVESPTLEALVGSASPARLQVKII